jgi:hypothetical protein
MNTLLKCLGGIILLIGVGVLLIPSYKGTHDNTILFTGLGIILFGFILHVFLQKRLK